MATPPQPCRHRGSKKNILLVSRVLVLLMILMIVQASGRPTEQGRVQQVMAMNMALHLKKRTRLRQQQQDATNNQEHQRVSSSAAAEGDDDDMNASHAAGGEENQDFITAVSDLLIRTRKKDQAEHQRLAAVLANNNQLAAAIAHKEQKVQEHNAMLARLEQCLQNGPQTENYVVSGDTSQEEDRAQLEDQEERQQQQLRQKSQSVAPAGQETLAANAAQALAALDDQDADDASRNPQQVARNVEQHAVQQDQEQTEAADNLRMAQQQATARQTAERAEMERHQADLDAREAELHLRDAELRKREMAVERRESIADKVSLGEHIVFKRKYGKQTPLQLANDVLRGDAPAIAKHSVPVFAEIGGAAHRLSSTVSSSGVSVRAAARLPDTQQQQQQSSIGAGAARTTQVPYVPYTGASTSPATVTDASISGPCAALATCALCTQNPKCAWCSAPAGCLPHDVNARLTTASVCAMDAGLGSIFARDGLESGQCPSSAWLSSVSARATLLSLNIYGADQDNFKQRIGAMIKLLQQARADVVALQEVERWFIRELLCDEYVTDYYPHRSDFGQGVGDGGVEAAGGLFLLSKYPLSGVSYHERVTPGQTKIDQRGRVLLAQVQLSPERTMTVATTCLDWRNAANRADSLDYIFSVLAPFSDVALLGDFNFDDNAPVETPRISGEYVDVWSSLHGGDAGAGPGYTWDPEHNEYARASDPESQPSRIDRIFLRSSNWLARTVRLVGCKGNLLCEGQIGGSPLKKDSEEADECVYPSNHFGLLTQISRFSPHC